MALTNIGQSKTPTRAVEITFAAETGLPSDALEVLLIGHAASGATGTYEVININNSGDLAAASTEAETKFGAGSELAKMVIAAVRANAGASTLPALKCVPLASTDTDFGASDEALTAVQRVKADFIVSPYDGTDTALGAKLETTAQTMSGAQRVQNNQFGSFGVVANQDELDPSALPKYDSQFMWPNWLPNSGSPVYSNGELAAACAAKAAASVVPFLPLNNVTVEGITAPANMEDWITVGAGLESEVALNQGWTPLRVKPNGEVSFVRTVTARLTVNADGVTLVGAYYDVQDFLTLYFFRKTLFTRFNQPDFQQRKASQDTAKLVKSEVIRLMTAFQDQGMFQAVDQLAPLVQVERNASDRHRFDVKVPVNVIPGLMVLAINVEAGTLFDLVTV